jgi:hypothetical protein
MYGMIDDDQKWYVRDGCQWRLRSGDITAVIQIMDDNATYKANIWIDGEIIASGDWDCLKKAKAVCLEAIEVSKEHIDDTA